jgi:hypothetical protein
VEVGRRGGGELADVACVVEDETVTRKVRCLASYRPERGFRQTYLGSTLPLLVAPGRPATGVSPMLVS